MQVYVGPGVVPGEAVVVYVGASSSYHPVKLTTCQEVNDFTVTARGIDITFLRMRHTCMRLPFKGAARHCNRPTACMWQAR